MNDDEHHTPARFPEIRPPLQRMIDQMIEIRCQRLELYITVSGIILISLIVALLWLESGGRA